MLSSDDPKLEFINYHGNTSLFALQALRRLGPIEKMKMLSVAALMPHLADYLALFHTVHHNTITETRLPLSPEDCAAKLVLHRKDFFELGRLEIDCVISHAAIHCLNDTRYGNTTSRSGWRRPYQAAAKLREVAGRTIPAFISVAVHREEGFFDNNAHLSHEKFVRSFEQAGFTLRDYFFDYVCGGIPQKPEYLDPFHRRSRQLPEVVESPKHWVIGSYYFA
jgi:hypothetical protein